MDIFRALRADPAPPVIPPAYQAASRAQLERDRKSFAAFRAVDQAEFERAIKARASAEVGKWAEEVRLFGEDIAELEPEAVRALAESRAAEDRAREAGEYARTQRLEYEQARGKVSVREETDASLRADAADETAHHAGQAAAQAAEESQQADAALAEAREGLAHAERQLERARAAAEAPAGEAPISDTTVRACAAHMQRDEIWEQLSDLDRRRVRQAGKPRDMMSAAELQAMLRGTFGPERTAV